LRRYIKELAERIIFIEGKLGSQAATVDMQDNLLDGFSPVVVNENAKRPFSSMSGDATQPPGTGREPGWAPEERPSQQTSPSHPAYGRGRLLAKRSDADPPERPADRIDGLPVELPLGPDREIDVAMLFR